MIKSRNLLASLMLALSLSASFAVPAFAAHEVLDPDTYKIEENEDEKLTCSNKKNGRPVTGWVEYRDELYYFKKGVMDEGWDKIDGEWYYFDPETGILATNTTVLNYDVDGEGRMIKIRKW